jgi:hypothetical protein
MQLAIEKILILRFKTFKLIWDKYLPKLFKSYVHSEADL